MYRSLTPWTELTRRGIPQFRVSNRNRPLFLSGEELPVGTVVPPTSVVNRNRLRLFYQQHVVEVVPGTETHPDSRDRQKRIMVRTAQSLAAAELVVPANGDKIKRSRMVGSTNRVLSAVGEVVGPVIGAPVTSAVPVTEEEKRSAFPATSSVPPVSQSNGRKYQPRQRR